MAIARRRSAKSLVLRRAKYDGSGSRTQKNRRDQSWPRRFSRGICPRCDDLEHIPERLVVDLVVVLHFGRLHKCSQLARRAVGCSLLQIGKAALNVGAEDFSDPLGVLEI